MLNLILTSLIIILLLPQLYGPLKYLLKRQKEGLITLHNSTTLLFITYQISAELSTVHRFKGGQGYVDVFDNS